MRKEVTKAGVIRPLVEQLEFVHPGVAAETLKVLSLLAQDHKVLSLISFV